MRLELDIQRDSLIQLCYLDPFRGGQSSFRVETDGEYHLSAAAEKSTDMKQKVDIIIHKSPTEHLISDINTCTRQKLVISDIQHSGDHLHEPCWMTMKQWLSHTQSCLRINMTKTLELHIISKYEKGSIHTRVLHLNMNQYHTSTKLASEKHPAFLGVCIVHTYESILSTSWKHECVQRISHKG